MRMAARVAFQRAAPVDARCRPIRPMTGERWVLVTPARNEAQRLPGLASSLAQQQAGRILHWFIVDDGSSDGTAEVPAGFGLPFPVTVLKRPNSGGLSGGSAFSAFRAGAEQAWLAEPSAHRVAKVDADVVLHPSYMERACTGAGSAGLVSGVIDNDPERADHVRGALKAYSLPAWRLVAARIPDAVGWDVLDEVLLELHGLEVKVIRSARATVTRRTGSSEGSIRGRRRAGRVSRLVGYDHRYFALRVVRYAFRRPYIVGALAMSWGYMTAGRSPFDDSLRRALRETHRRRLRALVRSPVRFIQQSYGLPASPRRRGQ